MDYSHVTQTGFFVTVKGTKQNTVIYAGDRWADFAWNGIGYNQWVPITKTGARPQFHSVSQWQFNATTGEWRVGPANNYILNPDIQADRVIVSSVRGWRNLGGSVTNVNGGVNGSRFALQISNSGGVEQRRQSRCPRAPTPWPCNARGSAGQVVVTGADGSRRTLGIPSSSGWAKRELTGIELPSGAATVTVRASGSGRRRRRPALARQDLRDTPRRRGSVTRRSPRRRCARARSTRIRRFFRQRVLQRGQRGRVLCPVHGDPAGRRYGGAGDPVRQRLHQGARSANVVVNGATVGTVSFEPTGAWPRGRPRP